MPCSRSLDHTRQSAPPIARCVRELSDRVEVVHVSEPEPRALRALAELLLDVALARMEPEDQEPSHHG